VDAFHRFPSHYPRLSFNALEQKASGGEERSPRENLVEKELDNFKTVRAFLVHQIDALENELLECMRTTAFTNDQGDLSHKFRAALSKAEGEILRLDEYFLTALGFADTTKEIVEDIMRACALKFESILSLVSECHVIIRDGLHADSVKENIWKPPSTFERKTTKYWVQLDKVISLQLAIIKYLPILNFTSKDSASDEDNDDDGRSFIDHDAKKITSVYFDSKDLRVYNERLNRLQGARLVRCRWYGSKVFSQKKSNANDIVFFERKTHHESWSLENSVKERFSLPRDQALKFYENARNGEEFLLHSNDRQSVLARDVFEDEFKGKSLSPAIRTSYRRTAFQHSDNNEVRISLDTNLKWFDEISNTKLWIEEGNDQASAKFPFAVLEVKLQVEETPQWIEDILREINATEVWKFSKFLHGTCVIRGAQISRFPHWWDFAAENDFGITSCPAKKSTMENSTPKSTTQTTTSIQITSTNSHETRSGNGNRDLAHVLASAMSLLRFRNYARSSARNRENEDIESQRSKRYTPIKIEPKTFFANERTLLQWLSMSTLLLFLSLGLLSFQAGSPSDTINLFRGQNTHVITEGKARQKRKITASDTCGLALAPVAILFMIYALFTYLVRANRIVKREPSTRYDDIFGPSALVSVLVIVSITSIVLVANQLSWE
jgi:uncharacterized membrane protein YidH (DUF202 family)